MSVRVVKVWECECGYVSLTGGKCRAHPKGPQQTSPNMGEPVEYVRGPDAMDLLRDNAASHAAKATSADLLLAQALATGLYLLSDAMTEEGRTDA